MQHRVAMPAHSARWLLSPVLGTGAGVGVGSAVGAGVGVAAVAGLPAVAGVHLPLVAGGVGYSHGQGDGYALIKGAGAFKGAALDGTIHVVHRVSKSAGLMVPSLYTVRLNVGEVEPSPEVMVPLIFFSCFPHMFRK